MSGMRHILDMPAEQLDSLLQARRHKAGEVEAIPRCPRQGDGGGTFPLSFAQQRLWLVHQLEPGSAAYNIPAAYRLRGPLRTGALAASFRAVARRHEVLRTTFATLPAVGEEPVQVVHAAADLPLPILDLRPLPAAAREVEAWRLAAGEARRPFDLTRGPLLRVRLLRLDEEEHALLLTFHHIVADGWSIAVLIREMGALYEAFSRDLLPMLPPLPVQYADFAVWQRHWLQEGALERQLAYWRRQLAALPALALPTDRPRPAVRDACGGQRFLHLEEAVGTALEALGLRQGATPFMTFLAAFQVLLARYSGQHDVAVGTPVAHRERSEIENLIGFFTKTLVLRADLSGDPPFRELLERVRDAALAAFAHQDVPFERLVEELQPARDAGRTPLVQAVFALQNHGAGMPSLGGLELSPLDTGAMGAMPAKFDLLLSVASSGGRWTAALEYDAGLFDAPTAGRMLGHFQVLLAGIARDPGQRLGELPLLSEAERHQLLRELAGGQDAAAVAGTLGSLHRGFEVQAGRSPDAVAVVCDGLALSYAELGRRAGRLARRLRRLGVGPEVPVGLCLERSADLVAAVLAVLAAGGAYVPLDPASPQERLSWILEDCGAPVLVTEERLLPGFGCSGGPVAVYLDRERDAIAREIPVRPAGLTAADHLAYVIYTSGSTGRPKGVLVSHANAVRLFAATGPWFGFGPDDVWTLFHSYAFDFSVWEIWGALLYGGRLVVVPHDTSRSPEAFLELLAREDVTVLNQTPSAFRQLEAAERTAEGAARPRALRWIVFGGEALDTASAGAWLARHGTQSPRLANMYGITETTVHVTWRPLDGESLAGGLAGIGGTPIGRPIPDLRLHVLDAAGLPVPLGVPGELFVGGAGLARGYLGRPELTAERFVPDPWSPAPGERLYRTGDLARRLPGGADGDLEYLGRVDHQVKVRGFRIELGEIEGVLGQYPGARGAVVVARREASGETRLIAYVAAPEGAAAELRVFARTRLPEPMVPSAIVVLEALPLTPNGKVDRRALPEPGEDRPDLVQVYVAPRTPLEAALVRLFSQVLGIGRVGVHDDFFELGGHSLKATQLASRIRRDLALEVDLREIFDASTAAALATALAGRRRRRFLPIAPAAAQPHYPLSHAQKRLWLIERMAESPSSLYVIPGAYVLHRAVDEAVLARCFQTLVERHESLRTGFLEIDGEPRQVVHPAAPCDLDVLDVVDLRGVPDRLARAAAQIRGEAESPFDLARPPLLRARLLRLDDGEHVLLLTLHHIIADGWSLQVLQHELAALYEAYSHGLPDPLPAPRLQYKDYAVWEHERGFDREEGFWLAQLADRPELVRLPFDFPEAELTTWQGSAESVLLAAGSTRALRDLALRHRTTPSNVVFAVFNILLYRLTEQTDLAVAMSIANRDHPDLEGMVGFFVNELVIRTRIDADSGFEDVLRRVTATVYEAFEHQSYPFDLLVEKLNPPRRGNRQPLFNVGYAFQNLGDLGTAWGDAGADADADDADGAPEAGWTTSKFDLTLFVVEQGERYRLTFEYSTELFRPESIRRHLETLARFLAAVGAVGGEA